MPTRLRVGHEPKMARINKDDLEAQLLRLESLDRDALIWAWRAAYGAPPPKKTSRDLLMKGIAYHLQCSAHGGLKPSTRRTLKRIAQSARSGSVAGLRVPPPALKSGTRLIRVFKGQTHEVEVGASGVFRWKGNDYASLSIIARGITGSRRNGPAFFGLRVANASAESRS